MRPFAERGYVATTAGIAAEAEVSPRTVTLYVPSNADLAFPFEKGPAERMTVAFTQRSPGESALDVRSRWMLEEGRSLDRERLTLAAAVFAANPELPGMRTAHVEAATAVGIAALASDLRTAPDDLLVRIMRSTAIGMTGGFVACLAAGYSVEETHAAAMTFLRGGIDTAVRARASSMRGAVDAESW